MARFLKNRENLVGQAPGAVVFIGNRKLDKTKFRLMCYNKEEIAEFESDNLPSLLSKIDNNQINWLNIDGVHDLDMIGSLGQHFDLSPIQTESIANTDQRPRVIEQNNKLVISLKALKFIPQSKRISSDQLTLILGSNILVTFQENVGTIFDPIRERLRSSSGKLRFSGPDYLAYRIMDTVADNYMFCLSEFGELVEKNEVKILSKNNPGIVKDLYLFKTELSYIRKAVWPVKEITKQLRNSDSSLLRKETTVYLRALDDLIAHSVETIDVYHTMLTDQLYIYNTNMANRTNDVMKVLTIFSSIFIPLTFIVGVYGTNFDNLPELHFHYGYYAMWLVILGVTAIMLFYFRRKKWL